MTFLFFDSFFKPPIIIEGETVTAKGVWSSSTRQQRVISDMAQSGGEGERGEWKLVVGIAKKNVLNDSCTVSSLSFLTPFYITVEQIICEDLGEFRRFFSTVHFPQTITLRSRSHGNCLLMAITRARAASTTVTDNTRSLMSGFDDTLTNLARPKTSAIITVRVIKSFEFRTERSLVLRDINLDTTTVGDLKEIVRNGQSFLRAS